MFSYTDDAIVTSSPTGRHLSTVIRRPAAIGPLDWSEHADQVCKVLNELKAGDALIDAGKIASDYQSRCWTLYTGVQMVGRVKRIDPENYDASGHATTAQQFAQRSEGPTFAELIDQGYLAPSHRHMRTGAEPRNPVETCVLLEQRIAELEKQLDDATTKLCAAQMLLEKPIEVTEQLAALLYHMPKGATAPFNNRTFKRVE